MCAHGSQWISHKIAGRSQGAPRILIFLIAMGAENLSCVKSIEAHACTFLPLNISAISSVFSDESLIGNPLEFFFPN